MIEMKQHWCEKYLGRKWDATEYNCWHFFRDAYAQERGICLPIYEVSAEDTKAVAKTIGRELDLREWKRVANPAEFDGVALGKGSQLTHVGIYTEADGGRIVHCNQGHGVVAMSLQQMEREGYRLIQFYRHADNLRDS